MSLRMRSSQLGRRTRVPCSADELSISSRCECIVGRMRRENAPDERMYSRSLRAHLPWPWPWPWPWLSWHMKRLRTEGLRG